MSAASGTRDSEKADAPGSGGWWGALSALLVFLGVCLLVFGLLSAAVRLYLPALLVIALGALSVYGAFITRRRGRRPSARAES